MEIIKCCFCGNSICGYGNNPSPLKSEGVCCDDCNKNIVIPYRILKAKKEKMRTDADAIISKVLQKAESEKLNALVGKIVLIEFFDGDTAEGVLHKDTDAAYMDDPNFDNTKIRGYYVCCADADQFEKNLHFKKSHIKRIRARNSEIVKEVCIPACNKHEGCKSVKVKLRWICPICGQPRGDIKNVRSYDGSLILFCNGWDNPCGHIDKYDALRKEAADNGLNSLYTEVE